MRLIKTAASIFHVALQFSTRSIKEHKEAIQTFILQHAAWDDGRILDFGCGEGLFSDLAGGDKNKFGYFGVDKDINSLNFAKIINRPASYIAGNERLCFKNMTFNFIILNSVMHHMSQAELQVFISEAKRVMREKAVLIIMELLPRDQQRGFFFRIVTYFEEKIKRIVYRDTNALENLFSGDFEMIFSRKMGDNYKEYIFALRSPFKAG